MKITVLIILFLLAASACSDSLGIEENVRKTYELRDEIIPLMQNNSWKYLVTYSDTVNKILQTEILDIELSLRKLINNKNYYKFSDTSLIFENRFYGNSTTLIERTGEDGFYSFSDSLLKDERLEFPYPAKIGAVLEIFTESGVVILRTVNSLEEKITTAAGDFKCLKITEERRENNTLYSPSAVYFLSPGYGLVKIIRYKISPLGDLYSYLKIELIDYNLY